MLTVAQSNELYDFMIDSFDLYKRMKSIPVEVRQGTSTYEFRQHYKIGKTKLEAIELSIEDTDPEISRSMANATDSVS